jgi:predicted DNA-binding transcriptional regulator AlpA
MEQIAEKNILPETGFVRLRNIIGDPKANPPIPAIIPVSRSSWYAGVKSGRYPPRLKIGPRTAVWRVEDIRAFIQNSAELSQEISIERNG